VVLPVAEVGDEILANLAGGVFSGVGVEALPVAQGCEGREANGEQDPPLVAYTPAMDLSVMQALALEYCFVGGSWVTVIDEQMRRWSVRLRNDLKIMPAESNP
jgi:hypothetical protein